VSVLHDQACFADNICVTDTAVKSIEEVAQDTFLVRVDAPAIASKTVPGQFVMIRFAERAAPLIGRALAVYQVIDDHAGRPQFIDLIFVRKGVFTTPLATAHQGTKLSLWGPLGNGFANRPCDTLVMAAGGIGQTPMLILAQEALGSRRFGLENRQSGWAKKVKFVYGARTVGLLACVEDFKRAGIEVELCTDDGSLGVHARVPDHLFSILDAEQDQSRTRVVTCGPEIMMEKVAEGCLQRNIDCQVSMETPMACGIGICFSCVAKVKPEIDQAWDYRRTCVEGPIFDAAKLVW
jgi:dihydroorotate dehydrogenase electron transfer subunit